MSTDVQQRLDLHDQLITQLVSFCGLQCVLLGLIAGGLQQLEAPVPSGVGSAALLMASAQRKLNELLSINYDLLGPDAQRAIREILEENQWPKSL